MMETNVARKIDELEELAKSRNDAWQISREEGELLRQIALVTNAKTIVEVGTSYGFSGLFWGSALLVTGGLLHTIDKDPRKVEMSKQTFAEADLADYIVNHQGVGVEVLRTLPGPFDIVFIDADKPATRDYFDLAWPKVRKGGSVLTDNITTHAAEMADFVRHVRSLSDAMSTRVTVGNGVEWTIKV